MQTLKAAGKTLVIAGAVLMLASPVFAGNGKGAGTGKGTMDRTQTRSQLKDGSCTKAVEVNTNVPILAAGKIQDKIKDSIRDMQKLQDGSCLLDEEA